MQREARARGEAAGQAVLDAAGISAHEAAAAQLKLEVADEDSVESDLPRDQINCNLSEREWTAAMAWGQAQDAAVSASCGGWDNRPHG